MLSIAIIYEDSGKRYTFPIEIAVKALKLKDNDLKTLEIALKKEIAKL